MDGADFVKILLTIIGSGALFSFIQFLITRKDKKEENTIDDKIEASEDEINKNLSDFIKDGEKKYQKHDEEIKELSQKQDRDYNSLREAIEKLTENDIRITESIDKLIKKQDIIGDSIIGITHFGIHVYARKITERKAITFNEKTVISSICDPYERLGGNGLVHDTKEYLFTLPVVSEEEANKLDREVQKRECKVFYDDDN